jgi:hypothetical protein
VAGYEHDSEYVFTWLIRARWNSLLSHSSHILLELFVCLSSVVSSFVPAIVYWRLRSFRSLMLLYSNQFSIVRKSSGEQTRLQLPQPVPTPALSARSDASEQCRFAKEIHISLPAEPGKSTRADQKVSSLRLRPLNSLRWPLCRYFIVHGTLRITLSPWPDRQVSICTSYSISRGPVHSKCAKIVVSVVPSKICK